MLVRLRHLLTSITLLCSGNLELNSIKHLGRLARGEDRLSPYYDMAADGLLALLDLLFWTRSSSLLSNLSISRKSHIQSSLSIYYISYGFKTSSHKKYTKQESLKLRIELFKIIIILKMKKGLMEFARYEIWYDDIYTIWKFFCLNEKVRDKL